MNKTQFIIFQERYKNDSNIAKNLGVTRQYIHQTRKKLQIPSIKLTDVLSERNKLINNYFAKGFKLIDISKNMDLSYKSICRIVNKRKKGNKNVAQCGNIAKSNTDAGGGIIHAGIVGDGQRS